MITRSLKELKKENPNLIRLTNSDKKITWIQKNIDKLTDGSFRNNHNGYWATIRRQDGQQFEWWGDIVFSEADENESSEQTIALMNLNGFIEQKDAPKKPVVYEHTISFDHVFFSSNPNERELQLAVQINVGQMTMAYCQLCDKNGKQVAGSEIQYLFPKKGTRDLEFIFNIYIPYVEQYEPEQHVRIKVLYFPKKALNGYELVKKSDQPYELLKWKNQQFNIISNPSEIDRTKKTLILFHGTFVDCSVSYRGLMKKQKWNGKDETVWLDELGKLGYQQVLGFNHPSVVDSAQTNAKKFREMMGLVAGSAPFTQPVDIITTSRGGLVGKAVCLDAELNSPGGLMPVNKVATVACANGCQWLSFAQKHEEKLEELVNIVAHIMPERKSRMMAMVTGIMQMDTGEFLKTEGMRSMTPGDTLLTSIARTAPSNPDTRYLPVCGDIDSINGYLKNKLLQYIIKKADAVLSSSNDLVIGTLEQTIMPDGYYAYGKSAEEYFNAKVNSHHLSYFNLDIPQKQEERDKLPGVRIWNFLADQTDNWK